MFFTISDARYFLGTVGLLNSLRLLGHLEPLFILDCGLTADQRALLEPHCRFVPFDRSQAKNPLLFKPFAQQFHPTDMVVIIDSDMVLTRPLDNVLALAEQGRICAYPDPLSSRWFADWESIFALPNAPRHQTYMNTGLVAFSARHWPHLLDDWWAACQRIWSHPTLYEGADHYHSPTSTGDQDAFNAVVMSTLPTNALAVLPLDEAPAAEAFREGVEIVDLKTLACNYRGRRTQLVHGAGSPKPWNAYAWLLLRLNPYVRLLRRLLSGPDLAVRVPTDQLPVWLKSDVHAYVRALDLLNRTVWSLLWRRPLVPAVRWTGRHVRRFAS